MTRTLLLASALLGAAPAAEKPNFILILVDDMGFTDLGCSGSAYYETPNIDRLATEGMRFTHATSACTVCSPTRAAVLTGKYPARLHVTDWIAGHKRPFAKLRVPDWTQHLPLEENTLAEALRGSGYATGVIGKWHLGGAGFEPARQGFEVNIGGDHRGQPPSYFSPYNIPSIPDGPKGEYLTDREGAEAEKFIEANRDRPFFLYLPRYAVHTPLQARPELVEKYRAKSKPGAPHQNPVYAAMIESLDASVGRILGKLEALGIAGRTVVIFSSDNGGLLRSTSNPPARAGKGSAYEGGVRVPLLVRWPGAAKPGSTSDAPVMSIDFFPTLLEIAGVAHGAVDGESIVPVLKGTNSLRREALFWHYPHYHPGGATPYGAVRAGDWRLVEFYEDARAELYNLKEDPGEEKDLAAAMPEKAAAMRKTLHDWRRSVGAQMPEANPDYDPKKPGGR